MSALEAELWKLFHEHAPSGFDITPARASSDGQTARLHGALPQTMHFGCMRVELATGLITFTDEDHRDGGDFEVHRVTVPLSRLSGLPRS